MPFGKKAKANQAARTERITNLITSRSTGEQQLTARQQQQANPRKPKDKLSNRRRG